MANHLDLEEQEQLDQLKHFWKQYGNLITWGLIAVLSVFAAWNGYQFWQRTQSAQAAAMYDEVEKVVRGGDAQKGERVFWRRLHATGRSSGFQNGLRIGQGRFGPIDIDLGR
jgi:predicted negative regulator of RcsB-dependent stress response